jgi:putative acetyltransferase
MIIRPELPTDRATIAALVERAFGRAEEAQLVARLRADGDAWLSLVAAEGEALVGHVLFSPMSAPLRALGLAPVAVAPERQRRGIAAALIRDGLDRARAAGWDAVFVVGDPAYYRRFGFDAALARGFASPYAGPHLMALALTDSLPVRAGAIDYAPAFAMFE